MKLVEIKESELKEITLFLIDKKIIFHPAISPKGYPDFSHYKGRDYTLIVDRNILTHLIRLLTTGKLKDEYSLRVIGSLMLWSQFNNVSVTSGIALSEYAHQKEGNDEASVENNLFLKAFNYYSPRVWLDIALGHRKTVQVLEVEDPNEYIFYNEYDHFKMHYLEMLKIAQLYFDTSLSVEDKLRCFHKWVYENILVCKYTNFYLALLLKGRVNTFNKVRKDFNLLISKCRNQAWDLSYLSLWSTLYYYENESNTIYLFATLDKDLKEIFMVTHRESTDVYTELFGNKVGSKIIESISNAFKNRELPKISAEDLDKLTEIEFEKLKKVITASNTAS